ESQYKLQDIRQRFTRPPDQSLLFWLYECWFFGAGTDVFLNSYEARQLGSLSRDVAVDRGIGRRMGTLSLWRRLVASVREAYTMDEVMVYRDRWNTKLEGVHYLTELAMADILYGNTRNMQYLDDPDKAYCTWGIWEAFLKSAPPFYAKALSSLTWHRDLKVLKLQAYVWDYRLKPSPLPQDSCVEIQPKEYAAPGDDPCTICHEELSRNTCELECGHEFHRECIRTWLLEHSSTCPICRDYAVLPADVPERPAWNNSKRYKAKAWKRSVF
ncbi:DZIP3 ligase, partial [Machaerirhynchus nigripectus]|nr:DZIP3 ligase [Machaerirhynchus nigripectus]